MMKLIQNIDVYAPQHLGKKDVLIINDKIVKIKDGAKDLSGAALVVAMAQGIMQVLGGSDPTTATVINTIMYNISNALS